MAIRAARALSRRPAHPHREAAPAARSRRGSADCGSPPHPDPQDAGRPADRSRQPRAGRRRSTGAGALRGRRGRGIRRRRRARLRGARGHLPRRLHFLGAGGGEGGGAERGLSFAIPPRRFRQRSANRPQRAPGRRINADLPRRGGLNQVGQLVARIANEIADDAAGAVGDEPTHAPLAPAALVAGAGGKAAHDRVVQRVYSGLGQRDSLENRDIAILPAAARACS